MAQEPDALRELGKRLDEAQHGRGGGERPAPAGFAVAGRFVTELVAAPVVGGCMGWGLDWAVARWTPFHTKPLFLVVFIVLGMAAGIRNIMRAARQLNEGIAVDAASQDRHERKR